jgi:uncharacterized protein (DUF362 family)
MAKVSIVRSKKPDIRPALDFINFTPKECEIVAIKPNISSPDPYNTGITTDLRILEQVLKMYEGLAERVVIESNPYSHKMEEVFEKTGAQELCEYYGAKIVNLSEDRLIPVELDYLVLKNFKAPSTILKADFLINLPVMKTHPITKVSLALKNMMGIIPGSKAIYHPRISEAIVDVMRVRKPDLNILDGIVGVEGRAGRKPKEMDLIMASTDAVALDTIACKVMGVNPINVEHIYMAGYYGIGEYVERKIQVVGETVENVRDKFEY